MRSIGIIAVASTVFVLYLLRDSEAQDCSQKHHWPLHVCPTGDGWSCWRDTKRRDINCKEMAWGNKTEFPNTRGFGWCYCCGQCRVPENIFA